MSVTKKQTKTPKPTKAKSEPVKTLPEIKFDDAVIMGRAFVAHIKLNERELGALADRVEPKYGEGTIAKLAEEIGLSYDTLKKYRTVYRAFKGKDIGETSPPFAVLSSLAPVPEAADILKAQPDITTAQARTVARDASLKKKGKKKPPKSRNDAGAIRAVLELAQKVHKEIGHVTLADIDADILRDELKDPAQAYAMLRRAGQDYINLADTWKKALASRATPPAPPEPMWVEAPKPAPPEQFGAAAE